MADWRYDIQYGPDGEANYAFVYDAEGALVSNLRTHHAKAVVDAMNRRPPSADPRPAAQPVAYRWRWAEDEEWRLSVDRPAVAPFVEPLYASPQPLTEGEPSDAEAMVREAYLKGRSEWCPASILEDNERTERSWQKARAALLAAKSKGGQADG